MRQVRTVLALLFVLLVTPASATGFIQAKAFNGSFSGPSTTITTPFTGNLTAGSELVMIMRPGDTIADVGPTPGVSDASNGNWTLDPHFPIQDAGGSTLYVYTFSNSVGGVNPTVTITSLEGSASLRIGFFEIGTSVTSGVTDISAASTPNTGTTPTIPSIATSNANDYLLAFFESSNGTNASIGDNAAGSNPSSGWTNRIEISAGAVKLYVSDNSALATGTYTEKFTAGTSDDFAAGMLAIKLSTGGGGGTPPMRTLMGVGQ